MTQVEFSQTRLFKFLKSPIHPCLLLDSRVDQRPSQVPEPKTLGVHLRLRSVPESVLSPVLENYVVCHRIVRTHHPHIFSSNSDCNKP